MLSAARLCIPLLVFALYYLTAPRTITLEDAGLFQLSCELGGFSHPPGYPLFSLLCQGFFLIPTDNPVLMGNLLSSVFAALAVLMLFELCRTLKLSTSESTFAALCYGTSGVFWSQAIIIEVYSLNALLFISACWAALRFNQSENTRYFYLLVLFTGLGLSNHWPLMVLTGPCLILIILGKPQLVFSLAKNIKALVTATIILLFSLSPYLLLWQRKPAISLTGPIENLPQFFDYVSRKAYLTEDRPVTIEDKLGLLQWVTDLSLSQLGPLGYLLIPLGLIVAATRLPKTVFAALLWLLFSCTWLLVMMVPFENAAQQHAVFLPYPSTAYLCLSVFAALAMTFLLARWKKAPTGITSLAMISVLITVIVFNLPQNNRRETHLADVWGRTLLSLPIHGAMLLIKGDNQTGVAGYLHMIEGVRKDIELNQWDGVIYPNRRVNPFDSRTARQDDWTRIISNSQRPVYSVEPYLQPSTNLGLAHKLSATTSIELDPRADDFLDYLLDIYPLRQQLHHHEQLLLFDLLKHYAYQYYDLTRSGRLPASHQQRMALLQDTFAAKIVLISNQPYFSGVAGKPELRSIFHNVTSTPDLLLSRSIRASLYQGAAMVALSAPPDKEMAISLLKTAISIFPNATNPAYCQLSQLTDPGAESC